MVPNWFRRRIRHPLPAAPVVRTNCDSHRVRLVERGYPSAVWRINSLGKSAVRLWTRPDSRATTISPSTLRPSALHRLGALEDREAPAPLAMLLHLIHLALPSSLPFR